MARPRLALIQIVEDPKSGREKQVLLTAKGQRFLLTMVERGRAFFRPVGEPTHAQSDPRRPGVPSTGERRA